SFHCICLLITKRHFYKVSLLPPTILGPQFTYPERMGAQFPPFHPFGKVVLLFLDDPRSPTACNWFRGRDQSEKNHILRGQFDPLWGFHTINQTGPAFTGREDVLEGCSLFIRKLQDSDAGPYTVSMMGLGGKDSVTGVRNLQLSCINFPFPSPSLFRENMDLVHLKCETTVKFANISWLQNGKPLSSCPRIQLSNNKQTLTIQPVLRHDAGAYQCQISNPFSAQRSDTTTISNQHLAPNNLESAAVVESGGDKGMSDCAQGSKGGEKWDDDDQLLQAPQPLPKLCSTDGPDPPVIKMTAKSLTQPSNGRLSCKASSFPEAEYCWFHNGKEFSKNPEILLKDIQSGTYTCQATNPFTQRKENTTLQIE
uniref:Ig-like domain-containing protein n=1 Tax=Naja naja TaxID=35670 RepID=A0A8C6Y1E1_NAJNA